MARGGRLAIAFNRMQGDLQARWLARYHMSMFLKKSTVIPLKGTKIFPLSVINS
jgi:hypothetical protein